MPKRTTKAGQNQAAKPKGAGRNGNVPPAEHRWRSGAPSPNPKGRPRTIGALREYIQRMGAETLGESDITRLDALLRGMFASKSAADREHVLAYGWGRPAQAIEVSGPDSEPLRIVITYEDATGPAAEATPGATADQD